MLMVHSFGSGAPPFTTHSTAFESTLKRELGTAVDFYEVSLDMAGDAARHGGGVRGADRPSPYQWHLTDVQRVKRRASRTAARSRCGSGCFDPQ